MWMVVEVIVWQPSVPQFSAPASLKVGRNTRDMSHDGGMEAHHNVARDPRGCQEASCLRREVEMSFKVAFILQTHTHTQHTRQDWK